jgi:hypothetical protein
MNIIGTSIMTKNIFKEFLLISLNTFIKINEYYLIILNDYKWILLTVIEYMNY